MTTWIPKPFGIDPSSSAFRRAALMLVLAALGLAGLAVLWWFLPVLEWLRALIDWVRGHGPRGVVVFALVGLLAHLVLAPASLFYIAAGLIYGRLVGFSVAAGAAGVAAILAFYLARSIARERVIRWLDGKAKLEALDQAVQDEGWKLVFMLRLSPMVPGPAQSYLFGLTGVPFSRFLPASVVGLTPWVLFFCWAGATGSAMLRTGEDALGAAEWAMAAAGLAVVGALAWLLTRRAKQYLEAYDLGG